MACSGHSLLEGLQPLDAGFESLHCHLLSYKTLLMAEDLRERGMISRSSCVGGAGERILISYQ